MMRMGRVLWALYTAEPSKRQLPLAGKLMAAFDPLIEETSHSLVEVREAVRKLKDGKAAGICNNSA